MKKFVLDTNVYIDAFRDPVRGEDFRQSYRALLPWIYMSSVVVEELLAGAETAAHARALDRNVLRLFERTGRITAPSRQSWKRSGNVLATLARREGIDLRRVAKSFVNDILIALSCREAGFTLVTRNLDDFARIRRAVVFDFTAPWPSRLD